MRGRLGAIVARAGLGMIAVAAAGCATGSSHLTPSGSTTTLTAGWEYKYTLDWSVEPAPTDTRRLRGYITSQHGELTLTMRVLGQALDASGNVLGQRIDWVPGGVAGFGRAYFEIAHLPVAHDYRVTVWDYTLLQSPTFIR
jgi:hypothetical protein